jgi:hypothetical protein
MHQHKRLVHRDQIRCRYQKSFYCDSIRKPTFILAASIISPSFVNSPLEDRQAPATRRTHLINIIRQAFHKAEYNDATGQLRNPHSLSGKNDHSATTTSRVCLQSTSNIEILRDLHPHFSIYTNSADHKATLTPTQKYHLPPTKITPNNFKMASAFHAIGNFFNSIFELFFSFFQTAYDLVATIISSIFSFIGSILNVFVEFFKGIVDVVGGLGKFVLGKFFVLSDQINFETKTVAGNAAIIMLVAAGAYGYLYYQRRQGNTVQVQGKKLN